MPAFVYVTYNILLTTCTPLQNEVLTTADTFDSSKAAACKDIAETTAQAMQKFETDYTVKSLEETDQHQQQQQRASSRLASPSKTTKGTPSKTTKGTPTKTKQLGFGRRESRHLAGDNE
jgi:hypothetical protein